MAMMFMSKKIFFWNVTNYFPILKFEYNQYALFQDQFQRILPKRPSHTSIIGSAVSSWKHGD